MKTIIHKLSVFDTMVASLSDKAKPLAMLGARLLIARIFLLSGLTKWDGFSINENVFYLFQDEYFAKYLIPEPIINISAIMASVAEIVLPILLIFGLFTRYAAAGLLIMTAVIQFFVYPDAWWTVHAWWAAILLIIVSHGPGQFSLDHLWGRTVPSQEK